ncbi:unknown protein [Seminavis robusta]|uniref:Uncharacterized protein n=1 Tax=Seminavis robusta TaxID=568900 RepID=A0A9N8HHL8_9STRA|nr:unknown protein [Seminavis robusta]|eukprot:Sro455_g146510.1 n/a (249) ;mRNA; r:27138-27884
MMIKSTRSSIRQPMNKRPSNRCDPPRLPLRRPMKDYDDDDVDDETEEESQTTTAMESGPTIHTATTSATTSSSRRLLRPDSVTALLHDFYDDLNSNIHSKSRECWKAFYEKYHAASYQMVRPSGNPLDSCGFIDLFCHDDIQLHEFALVRVDRVQLLAGGLVAVVIYTVDQIFSYKGIRQEDRAVLTCVVEELHGDLRIRHEHRSNGRPLPVSNLNESSSSSSRWEEHQSQPIPATKDEWRNTKQSVF